MVVFSHNPALGWNPIHVLKGQPDKQHQEYQQYQQQHSQRHNDPSTRQPQHETHSQVRGTTQYEAYTNRPGSRTPRSSKSRLKAPPSTPHRNPGRNASRSPFKEMLRSAGRVSRSLLSTPRRTATRFVRPESYVFLDSSDGEDSDDGEDDDETCWSEHDKRSPVPSILATPGRTRMVARGRGSRELRRRDISRGDIPSPTAGSRRSAGSTWQHEYRRVSPLPNRSGDRQGPCPESHPSHRPSRFVYEQDDRTTESELSDLNGNRSITRMNGLLDIWDSKDNPRWEEDTFALCDLSRCGCGRFYVPMKTVRHTCRER